MDDPTETGDADASSSGEPDPTQPDPDDGSVDPTDGASGTETSGGGSSFITEPEVGGTGVECDLWHQDCPDGTKCMPWANDGGNSWNATTCSPITPKPGRPGEACTVEGSRVSGVDDCALGSMCWFVNADGVGTCVAFCHGSPDTPGCADPEARCSIDGAGVLALCLPTCDPIAPVCPADYLCAPSSGAGTFLCTLDGSGDSGMYGDPCEFVSACTPGLFCAARTHVPGCTSGGCCSEFCDINLGDAQCTGAAEGQRCLPWWADPTHAPLGLEHVGLCGVP